MNNRHVGDVAYNRLYMMQPQAENNDEAERQMKREEPSVMKLRHPRFFPLNFFRFPSASRLLLSDSCLDRALAVLTLWLVVVAVPTIAHGTETPSSTNDTKAILSTQEELAGASQRFQDAKLDYVQGQLEKAETGYRGVIEIRTRLLGAEHPDTLDARRSLASALSRQRKYAEAESELRGVLAVSLRGYGKSDPIAWSVHQQLAAVLEWQSRYAEAEKEWRTALQGFEHCEGPKDFFINRTRLQLAKNLAYQHKKEEALAMARQAHEGYRKSQGDNDQITKQAKILVDMIENPMWGILGCVSYSASEWFGSVGVPYLKIVMLLLPITVMWYSLSRILEKRQGRRDS